MRFSYFHDFHDSGPPGSPPTGARRGAVSSPEGVPTGIRKWLKSFINLVVFDKAHQVVVWYNNKTVPPGAPGGAPRDPPGASFSQFS